MPVCMYASMQEWKYTIMQVCKYVYKYTNIQLCKFINLTYKLVNMQVHKYATMQVGSIWVWKCESVKVC